MKQNSKKVTLTNITKIYDAYQGGEPFKAVDDISLDVQPGEFVTLLGPSGCGKSTTLRMIAGFEFANYGDMFIGETRVNDLAPNNRNTAMVFQSYALFPHLNIYDNVAYGLKIANVPKPEIKKRVTDILELVGLEDLGSRTTGQISGGQQQRVALARALIMDPDLLLFDEPLSNLDAKLRVYMRTEIKKIQRKMGITTIYVTHDQSEAMSLSDRIIIMNKGIIEQVGTPEAIYYKPESQFVAEFIGNANFTPFVVEDVKEGTLSLTVNEVKYSVPYNGHLKKGDKATFVVRPEAIDVGEQGDLVGKVLRSTFMGQEQEYEVEVNTEQGKIVYLILDSNPQEKKVFHEGEEIHLSFKNHSIHVIDIYSKAEKIVK